MPEAAAPAPVPAKGTRPEGAQTEAEASRKVREMFTEIAPRYDFLNHLLSLDMDRVWRARTARRLWPILERRDARVLDLCCGTGDLAFALARQGPAQVTGADFSHAMLVRANTKSKAHVRGPKREAGVPAAFLEADALRLPFAEASFDLVTAAFGFRNLANYEHGLKEIRRVLKCGGTLAILEFTEPPPGVAGDLYRWYCRKVLPKIGGLLSGNPNAYKYLPASVARFFRPEELTSLMTRVGYGTVAYELWTLGSVALHTAKKVET
ncbi:MAG TPA: bifunctional demethylmenaquinone methyltransferase/2-methoxy-6-polyprenyl-1,4-benzoquinol methylase UbiE [Candidatus Acidoferrum sp.]|nr:bifunctional demethylmenaquinone methyltransferase/2-methoxy-6-polyprenyl-1,4-benzoquinol methylase UbiE [Candidatus Acidoferrum sp.]